MQDPVPTVLVLGTNQQHGDAADCWKWELETMHEYDYVITTVQMISPSKKMAPNSKLSAMAAKSYAMCVAGTGPLFDLLICDEAHHAMALTWDVVFTSLCPIAQTFITEGHRHELRPKQLLLTGTSHRLQEERFPVQARHNLRIWTLTQACFRSSPPPYSLRH